MQRVLAVLRAGDRTQAEIVDRAYVAATTLQAGGYMKALVAAALVHVCRWVPPATSGNWAPVYRYGPGVNVPPPPPAGNTEYARRWRHKRGADQKKIRRQMEKLTPARFSLAGLLGLVE